MLECPSCSATVDESTKVCPECGRALLWEHEPTQHYVQEPGSESSPARASAEPSSSTPGSPSVHGRFVPGAMVADRYRIVSLVGKGGMGEVYRADDLKLAQTVALKFLPDHVARSPKRMELFLNEVRLTRQISHPNVCRVYDIGEVDGRTFLSMEYVDGEDLQVLLRRVGRIAPDRGLEIAKQICAGVAAAHVKGVLHRDLKPANVMIDGRGHARVTDFGLAKLVEDGGEAEIAGTPAYMAPEQLDKGEASLRSDVYSLGLILYELFTGKRVHAGGSIADLLASHRDSSPTDPSEVVEGLVPVVSQLILRCLAKDPGRRPASATAVAAALPGGDPLAAALLAGETPSPELVAASGSTGTLPLPVGIACFALLLVGLVVYPFLSARTFTTQAGWKPNALSPSDLDTRARTEILGELGYWKRGSDADRHSAHGFQVQAWGGPSEHRLEFWYRTSQEGFLTPDLISNYSRGYVVSANDPLPTHRGMANVRLDLDGRLVELFVPNTEPEKSKTTLNSDTAFLTAQAFSDEAAPLVVDTLLDDDGEFRWPALSPPDPPPGYWTPPTPAEVTVYTPPGEEGEELGNRRLVVAENAGRIVYFYAGPLTDQRTRGEVREEKPVKPGLDRQFVSPSLEAVEHRSTRGVVPFLGSIVFVLTVSFGLLNLRSGRVDREGALRFAVWIGTFSFAVWVFAFDHFTNLWREDRLFIAFVMMWSGYVFRHWLYYVALEPYVRRYWPNVLIAWTRLTDGGLRDPLVGREILVGCVAGLAVVSVVCGMQATLFVVANFDTSSVLGPVAPTLTGFYRAPAVLVWFLMQLFLLRLLLRNSWLAVAAVGLIYFVLPIVRLGEVTDASFVNMLFFGCLAIAITRVGLLCGVAYMFAFHMTSSFLITTDLLSDYGTGACLALTTLAAVGTYAFWTSTLAHRFTPSNATVSP